MTAPLLELVGIRKAFGTSVAVDDVSLDVAQGEFFALLGPSGCGKTTLLRMIAGLDLPDAGTIRIGGEDMAGVSPNRRPANMVFQSYALFPHMSVAANIGYGLRIGGMPRPERERRVAEALALVRLEGLDPRRPHQLSGGQRQRVALARALVLRPRVLLLDEPLSALDAKLREEMQGELARIQADAGITFVMVTHDQDEAMALATRCAVMNRGRVEQVGRPSELYARPASGFVAGFVGRSSLLPAVRDPAAPGRVVVPALRTSVDAGDIGGDDLVAAIRPEDIAIVPSGEAAVCARIVRRTFLGSVSIYHATLADGTIVQAQAPGADAAIAPGTEIGLRADPHGIRVIAR